MSTSHYNVSTLETEIESPIWMLCINVLLATIGTCANLSVVIVFINCKIHRRSFPYLLVFQQSLIDLLANCLFLIFYFVYPVAAEKSNDIYCKSSKMYYFFLSASSLNLVFISVERYIAVVHPFQYRIRRNNKRNMLPQLSLPFIAAFLITFHSVFLVEPYPKHLCISYTKIEVFRIYSGTIYFLNVLGPICVMIFCYYRIYVTLTKQFKVRAELTNQSSQNRTTTAGDNDQNAPDVEMSNSPIQSYQVNKAQRNFIDTMLINTLIYIVCNAPLAFLFLVDTICEIYIHYLFTYIFALMMLLNTAANPFVYAYKFNDYRIGLSKTFCCR
ncbi:trace amine-associated receptor 1-like [Anneissia japonica]|uniref:trace amine-associated receptor 1-like n=1 Tax=Anneissia japonica TaxID=1529436 RepID=UPI001425B931|nr:trace amine-associated receptor 1-like [Anneissia japonica]